MKFIALLFLLCWTAIAQQSFETIQIIPKQDDSTTGELRFREKWGSPSGQYVGLKAPSAITANVMWVLPDHDGTSGQCLTTNGASDLQFTDCGTGGPLSLTVPDTTSISKGSVDAPKAVRFEVDGLPPATTRVLTVPDADITSMGRENNETINGTKTFASNILFTPDATRTIGADATRPLRVYAR